MENGHEPATKADVAAVSADVAAVRADVAALRAEVSADVAALKADLTAVEERVIETMRDIQTEMLKVFYSVAESNHKRLTDGERQAEALKERLALPESRVLSVEKRLNIPPAA